MSRIVVIWFLVRDVENTRHVIIAAVIVRYGASEIGEVVGGLYGLSADDRLLGYGGLGIKWVVRGVITRREETGGEFTQIKDLPEVELLS